MSEELIEIPEISPPEEKATSSPAVKPSELLEAQRTPHIFHPVNTPENLSPIKLISAHKPDAIELDNIFGPPARIEQRIDPIEPNNGQNEIHEIVRKHQTIKENRLQQWFRNIYKKLYKTSTTHSNKDLFPSNH